MLWFKQGLCFLPAFLVIWSSSTFIISYIIAIFRDDVDIIFPYISDTGAEPPESCLFGLMTFISACAGIATMYARYKFVEKLSEERIVARPCLNRAGLAFGVSSCLGMCIVATFQETTVTIVHDFGALLFFLSGVVYLILQSVISCHSCPFGSSVFVCRVRWIVTIIAALAIFPSILSPKSNLLVYKKSPRHLCILCERNRCTAQRQSRRGLSLPLGQRCVRVDCCLQLHLLLPHIHQRFQTVYLTRENRVRGVILVSLQLAATFLYEDQYLCLKICCIYFCKTNMFLYTAFRLL